MPRCCTCNHSLLNDCSYCAKHHSAGLKRKLKERAHLYEDYLGQLDGEAPGAPYTPPQQAALRYARKLTLQPGAVDQDDVDALRAAGLSDGQILEVNQVTAYFGYANRTVTGLGVHTEGEVLGLSPGKEDDWHHQ